MFGQGEGEYGCEVSLSIREMLLYGDTVHVVLMLTRDWCRDAQKEIQNIALDNNFSIPGDPGFPLNQVCYNHSSSAQYRLVVCLILIHH